MNTAALLVIVTASFHTALPVRGIVEGPDGKPVEDADVFLATHFDPAEQAAQTRSSRTGEFQISEPRDEPFNAPMPRRQLIALKAGVGIGSLFLSQPPSRPVTVNLQATAPVRVLVVDPAQKPVVGAEVRVREFTLRDGGGLLHPVQTAALSTPHLRRKTNAQGEATFELVPAEAGIVFAVHTAAFGIQTRGFPRNSGDLTLALRPVGKLRGRLETEGGTHLAGVPLVVRSNSSIAEAHGERSGGHADVRTDAEGRFEIPALAAGEVVIAGSQGADQSRYSIQETTLTLKGGETHDVDVPTSVRVRAFGRIVDDGPDERPIGGIHVHFDVFSRFRRTVRDHFLVVTDANGMYECFTAPWTLKRKLEEVPPPYLAPVLDLSSIQLAGGGDVDLGTIRLKQGSPLKGTVVDPDNGPIPRARVEARWALFEGRRINYHSALAETDERGAFQFPALPNFGKISLRATDATRGSLEPLIIDGADPVEKARLAIDLTGLFSISGRVIGIDGNPVGGVAIHIVAHFPVPGARPARDSISIPGRGTLKTDAEGKFTTPRMLSGVADYEIQVGSPGEAETTVVVPRSDPEKTAIIVSDIVLAPKP